MLKRKEYCALFDTRVRTDPYTGRDRRETVYIGPYYTLDVDGAPESGPAGRWRQSGRRACACLLCVG